MSQESDRQRGASLRDCRDGRPARASGCQRRALQCAARVCRSPSARASDLAWRKARHRQTVSRRHLTCTKCINGNNRAGSIESKEKSRCRLSRVSLATSTHSANGGKLFVGSQMELSSMYSRFVTRLNASPAAGRRALVGCSAAIASLTARCVTHRDLEGSGLR